MDASTFFILLTLLLCLFFDFTNGFHDGANSIATIVATGTLSPRQAVVFAAFFNFIAFFLFKTSVAHTVATEIVNPLMMDPYFVFSTITAAITWNLITWFFGIPSSSSHALVGGMVGAALVKSGIAAIKIKGLIAVIFVILVSPLLGILVAYGIGHGMKKLSRHLDPLLHPYLFKYLQLCSSATLSLAHGTNDAQKTIGIIMILLFSSSWVETTHVIPLWVSLSCYCVIALGTLTGGWRIVNTMSKKITVLDALRGASAEASAAFVILSATHFGFLASTTYTVTGAVAGVGLHSTEGTRWGLIWKIFLVWLITLPITGLIAGLLMLGQHYK